MNVLIALAALFVLAALNEGVAAACAAVPLHMLSPWLASVATFVLAVALPLPVRTVTAIAAASTLWVLFVYRRIQLAMSREAERQRAVGARREAGGSGWRWFLKEAVARPLALLLRRSVAAAVIAAIPATIIEVLGPHMAIWAPWFVVGAAL